MVGFLMPPKLRCFVHILLRGNPKPKTDWRDYAARLALECLGRDLGTAASEREEGRLEISA